MFIGTIKNREKSMRIYYQIGQHYVSSFLVEFISGTQKTHEKQLVGLNNLYDEISKFKGFNNETKTN